MKIQCTAFTLMLLFICCRHTLADGAPAKTLDALYQAGSDNDASAFLALLSTDSVFLGIDGSDRLQGQSLYSFIDARFARGAGWGYLSRDRELRISEDGSVAWFEESLEHDAAGRGWGSGVMVKTSEGWKIAQYNLSVSTANDTPIPAATVTREVSDPAKNVSNDTSNVATATEAEAIEPEKKKACRKIRHKTNKVSRC